MPSLEEMPPKKGYDIVQISNSPDIYIYLSYWYTRTKWYQKILNYFRCPKEIRQTPKYTKEQIIRTYCKKECCEEQYLGIEGEIRKDVRYISE